MKAKRWISLLLAVSMMLGVLAMPALAATQQPESTAVVSEELPDAAALSAAEDENDIVNIRIRATGNLVYGSDYKLEVETRPENTQYIAVVLGTSGEAYGYVTLMISDKLRTLLKLIPLPKKMSQTPDQAEEFNVYSYLKQLIDGNDVSVLLRVADEVVSVMDTVSFFVPASYLTTVKNVSNGMKLALSLIRKYLRGCAEPHLSGRAAQGQRQVLCRCHCAGKQRYQRRRVCHVQDQAQDRKRQPELGSRCPGQHDRLPAAKR
mgnify:CR=1 FL=1